MADALTLDSGMNSELRTVYLTVSDSNFFSVVDELSEAFRSGMCVPVLGAGLSLPRPSCMPLGGELESRLRDALWTSIAEFQRHNSLSENVRQSAERIIGAARLERMLDVLQQTHGSTPVYQFLSVLRGKDWNMNHAAIAALANAGYLPDCVTLNFDLLIEEAVAVNGVAETLCPLSDHASFFVPDKGGVPNLRIIKPHGSLAPRHHPRGEFGLLAPTLADVGNQPDERNQTCIGNLLGDGRCLLAVGYSDHDWDVFPILQERSPFLSHVYWVEYLPPDAVSRRGQPHGISFERICDWLRMCGRTGTLLLGDPSNLLEHICARLGVSYDRRSDTPVHAKTPPIAQFLSGPDETLATSVSFALLLQDRGRFHDALVNWLLSREDLQKHPLLAARLHRTAAHSCHTRRDLRRALRHMKRSVHLKQQLSGKNKDHSGLGDEFVWMGYEHLCLLKRPSLRWLLILPAVWHWYHGIGLMKNGLRLAHSLSSRKRRRLRAMVRFYRGDLLHSWASLAFIVGGPAVRFGQFLCRRASTWYSQARRIDLTSMGWEYYWMRTIEARLLSGTEEIEDTEAMLHRIEQIEWSYKILQNQVQRGNTLAYRALITGKSASGRSEAKHLLEEAEEIWTLDDGFVPSGLMRVILFRRVLGIKGLVATLRDLWSLRRSIRARQRKSRH